MEQTTKKYERFVHEFSADVANDVRERFSEVFTEMRRLYARVAELEFQQQEQCKRDFESLSDASKLQITQLCGMVEMYRLYNAALEKELSELKQVAA